MFSDLSQKVHSQREVGGGGRGGAGQPAKPPLCLSQGAVCSLVHSKRGPRSCSPNDRNGHGTTSCFGEITAEFSGVRDQGDVPLKGSISKEIDFFPPLMPNRTRQPYKVISHALGSPEN